VPPKRVGPFQYDELWAAQQWPIEDLVRYLRRTFGETWRLGLKGSEDLDLLLMAREELFYRYKMGD
jgi:predicted DNA-binding protein (UPF0278 family)